LKKITINFRKGNIETSHSVTLINIIFNFRKTQASQSKPGSAEEIVDSIVSNELALETVHDLSDGKAAR